MLGIAQVALVDVAAAAELGVDATPRASIEDGYGGFECLRLGERQRLRQAGQRRSVHRDRPGPPPSG